MNAVQAMLRRQVAAAWRHRWAAVAFAWLICLGGWVATTLIPNQYEASARLYVDADAVLTPLLKGLAIDDSISGQLEVLQRTLLSRPNLEKLVSKTDLELSITGPSDLERTVQGLGNSIKIAPQTKNLFTITYRDPQPKLAYDVVNALMTTFIESKSGNNRADLQNAQVFLQRQIDTYERQLRDAERTRAEFRAKYIDLLPNEASGGNNKLELAQTAVRQIQGELTDATTKRDMLNKELATTPPLVVTETDPGGVTGGGGGSRACITQAEQGLNELTLRFTDDFPEVKAARDRVAQLRRTGCGDSGGGGGVRTPARNRSLPNPVYEQLKVRMVENETVIASLTRQMTDGHKERDRLDAIARSAPGLQAEFINMNRDYDVLRKNYDELLVRRESMRIGAAADADADKVKLRIVDPPQVPQNPVAPKRVLLLTGVLLAGLGGGIGLAVMLVQLDRSFHTVDDLRGLGLPVVGGVSALATAGVALWRRLLGGATFATAVLLLCVIYGGLLMRVLRTTGSLA